LPRPEINRGLPRSRAKLTAGQARIGADGEWESEWKGFRHNPLTSTLSRGEREQTISVLGGAASGRIGEGEECDQNQRR